MLPTLIDLNLILFVQLTHHQPLVNSVNNNEDLLAVCSITCFMNCSVVFNLTFNTLLIIII